MTYPNIRLGYALGDYLLVALLVASVTTILTLITNSVKQEIVAECTKHELVELLLNKLVSIHFVNLAFSLPDGTLPSKATQTAIQRAFSNIFFHYRDISKSKKGVEGELAEVEV